MSKGTHAELCSRGKNWLKNAFGCQIAFEEIETPAGEQPDAFGVKQGLTVLIEVKISKTDFASDKKKPWRKPNEGMGQVRYFLTPKGLISPDVLPNGWGLLEATDKQIKVIKGINPKKDQLYPFSLKETKPEFLFQNRDIFAETYLLASVLRRVEIRVGDLQLFTKYDGKVTA
jgi:hypothetical protein